MMPDVKPIDANALYDEINSMNVSLGGVDIFTCHAKRSVLDSIELQDTLDYEPVKHGEWVLPFGSRLTPKCSSCGWCIPYSEDSKLDARNFCPNCGAKMDGDKHDH